MMARTYVVAGDYRQFRNYLTEAGILPTEARYIGNPDAVYGVRNPIVVLVGTYDERGDWPAILERLGAAGANLTHYPDED